MKIAVKIARTGGAAALLLAAAAFGLAADVVVLRGGARIELKGPWVQQGNMALMTRADGTLLSVPVSEIDLKATSAAKARSSAAPASPIAAPPETPAAAARMGREGPKARVKLTDRDVGHYADFGSATGEKKEADARGGGRLEIADYTQERAGGNLVVRGSMRNSGGTSASNVRLTVSVLDEKGQAVASGPATLSSGLVEPGAGVSFSAGIPVGDKQFTQIRFAPQWIAAPPPAPEGAGREPGTGTGGASGSSAAGAAPASAAASQAPQPQPTPWGRGLLYAPPPPASAPSTAPADGKTGYLPGAANPDSQPKPPK